MKSNGLLHSIPDATGHSSGHLAAASGSVEVENGARSSEIAPRYDLLEPDFLEDFARRMGAGAVTHGERNYQLGGAAYRVDRQNHLEQHLIRYKRHGHSEDLIAIACNTMILWWLDRKLRLESVD